jgi:DNA-binding MarR family transcriptional regulator
MVAGIWLVVILERSSYALVSFFLERFYQERIPPMSTSDRDHVDEIISEWARERPDLDVDALGLLGRLFRFVLLADAVLGEGLERHGLQPGWFDLLAALRRAGPPYQRNPTELMRATLLSSGGMTKRLDRLAEAGLVERRPDPHDRRGTLVRLTRRGKALVDRALVGHLANEEWLLAALDPAERRRLDKLLRKLLSALEAAPEVEDRPTGPRSGGLRAAPERA